MSDGVRRQALLETLMLWRKLSEMPDQEVFDLSVFKNGVLSYLGIPHKKNGCPLCNLFWDKLCPLGDCAKIIKPFQLPCEVTPFGRWEDMASSSGRGLHSQRLAKKFYVFLVEKFGKEVEGKL
jgi:hypothetical protein